MARPPDGPSVRAPGLTVRFETFERAARDAYDRIPEEYKVGIDGLRVERDALPHPSSPDVYTLGECITEAYPSDWEGPDTTRSVVALYHGSFRHLEELDPEFDWEEELWETLTHELRHHLEWLAREDGLEGVDYAMDEEFKRWQGDPFDPWYFQWGDALEEKVYRVERRFYLEQEWDERDFEAADRIRLSWRGTEYEAPRPAELGDVHFVRVLGPVPEEEGIELEVVLVRTIGWWESLRRLFSRESPVVHQSEATVRPVEP